MASIAKCMRERKAAPKQFTCPMCGASYRHESMALQCSRTAVCRAMHRPFAERKELWRLVGGVGYLAAYYAFPVWDNKPHDTQEWQLAEKLRTTADKIFAHLFERQPMGEWVRRIMHKNLMLAAAKIWAPYSVMDPLYMGEIVTAVAHDALHEAIVRGYAPDAISMMRATVQEIDAMYEFYTAGGARHKHSAEEVDEAIYQLDGVIIGIKPEQSLPSLYLVDGWQLVVAHGRGEVRRVLADYGKTQLKSIAGIAQGEKFEDGRTAASIISLYSSDAPAIVGEVEA